MLSGVIWEDSYLEDGIGNRRNFRHGVYLIKNGRLAVKDVNNKRARPTEEQVSQMKSMLDSNGYKLKRWNRNTENFITKTILVPMIGHSTEELEEYIKKKSVKLFKTKEYQQRIDHDWERLYGLFNGYIIGLDRIADVYDGGFSIRILMKSTISYDERRRFVKERKADIAEWVVEEFNRKNELNALVGDIDLFVPKEIVVLKIPELDFVFAEKKAS